MKFFIDTANIEEIKEANTMGMVDGVTTNPTLVAKEGREFEPLIKEICQIVDGPVNAEVISTDAEGMVAEARKLAKIADNIVVKIPMTVDGLKAVRKLAGEGIKTNVTLIFSPLQALMAAKAGAAYVSPFVGRLDDLSQDGLLLAEQIVEIYSNYAFDTEIIVASVRNPLHVLESALMGADIIFMPHASPRGTPEEKFNSWMRHLPARAYDNSLFVVACNQAGSNGRGLKFPGLAVIIGPHGQVVERSISGREGLLVADLEASDLDNVRGHPMRYFLPNRRPELYG